MGGSSSNGYDKVYNAGMLEVAQDTFGLSEKAFDSWDLGGERELEEATAQAGMTLLPQKTAFEGAQMDYGIEQMANKSGISKKFYDSLGEHSEDTAVSQAGADVAGAISDQKGISLRDAGRRGVAYKPGGMGLNGAKLKVAAMTDARERTRATNLNELATGMGL